MCFLVCCGPASTFLWVSCSALSCVGWIFQPAEKSAPSTPRTLFLMPTVSIISGTSGWFLAVKLGYTGLEWPAYGWMAAALVLVTLMTIQGFGFLTPVNVFVCLELQKGNPNMTKVSGWMQRYFYVVALQGIMQVAIIVVMTRFRVGI